MTEKFRNEDTSIIYTTLKDVIQIKSIIEDQCIERKLPVSELEMSLVPSDILYNMSVCYEAMYNKLLDDSLIKTGYPKTNKKQLH